MGKTRTNVFTCDYCMQQTARPGSDWAGVGAVSILFTSHKNRQVMFWLQKKAEHC